MQCKIYIYAIEIYFSIIFVIAYQILDFRLFQKSTPIYSFLRSIELSSTHQDTVLEMQKRLHIQDLGLESNAKETFTCILQH